MRSMMTMVVLAALQVSAQAPKKTLERPWRDGKTLGDKMTLEETMACTDGKDHFIVRTPTALYTGSAKAMSFVSDDDWFLEPRHFNPKNNDNYRGADLRIYSKVSFDPAKGVCELECGTRKVVLKLMPEEQRTPVLLGTTLSPALWLRQPHVLLRDETGTYFYVDKGVAPGEEKNFRLFIGTKGAMKLQKMTNVVSDSEGEIFSTKAGDLRLIIDRRTTSTWTQGKNRVPLRDVPVRENMPLIYTELNIYTGERLGTPCDDL